MIQIKNPILAMQLRRRGDEPGAPGYHLQIAQQA